MLKNKLFYKKENLSVISSYAKRMSKEASSGVVGYYSLARQRPDLSIFKANKKDVILVGMGGQSAGVKAVRAALGPKRVLLILDNITPSFIEEIFAKITLNKSIFIISSKSGNTVETLALFDLILDHFKIPQAKIKDYFYFITDENSKLHKRAKSLDAKCFFMPANVGGRFSILSLAGLIPLAMSGYDIDLMLAGAKSCYDDFFEGRADFILQKAYHLCTHKSASINVLFSYDLALLEFNEWFKQLLAESLGKQRGFKRVGLTPITLIGSKDQHSFLQLMMDGPKDKSVTFIKILSQSPKQSLDNPSFSALKKGLLMSELLCAQCDATAHALIAENISVDIIELERLDAWHLGYLIYYYQLFTSSCALMLGINAYDQPGVEAGKVILRNLLI